jgi:hypothetical protein
MKKITLLAGLFLLQSQFISAQTATFNYTGSVQTFTVPACVTSITVDVQGGSGGTGPVGAGDGIAHPGGLGGRTQATITVSPGDVLTIYVGGAGANDNNTTSPGGFNGGGTGMLESSYTYYGGGGGGGASDIRLNGNALTDRIVVAGGGGGGGADGCTANGLDGGAGGGLTGGAGSPGSVCVCNPSGQGGTPSAGGVKGDWGCSCNAQAGSLGLGGNSKSSSCGGPTGGGGGGGGYYGGGGGGLGGGGGGSNYVIVTATGVTHTQGFRSGDGTVVLTYITALPTAGPITGSSTICANASGNYSIPVVVGATTYAWTVPSGTVINSGQGTNSINITAGSTSGTISVTATVPCGTTAPATLTLTINPAPVVSLGANITQCGGTAMLDAGNPGATYLWSNAATTQTITVSTSGTYSVVVTNASGCTGTGSVNVTINTPPTVALGTNVTQCGGTVPLDAGNPGSTYAWSNSATTQTITVSTSGTYSVLVTDANGCTGTGTINVTINTPPTVALGSDVTQCGGTVPLDAGNAGSAYAWSNSATTQTITVSTSGTYSVIVTDANGCTGTDAIDITINAAPVVTLTLPNTTVCITIPSFALSGGSPSGGTYSGTGVSGGNFDPSAAGLGTFTITYDYTDVNGCTGQATQSLTVDACTGVENGLSESEVNIFPNPSHGNFVINIHTDGLKDAVVTILDVQGKVVYTYTGNAQGNSISKDISLSHLSSGVYSLQVITNLGVITKKLVIQE